MIYALESFWLDRYELLSKLGEGGFGVVYEARDHTSGERVALKELTHVNIATLARFKQEFRAVQEVLHPNLVRLDALFEDRGKWVIAMELVEGKDLLDYVYTEGHELGFNEPQLRDVFYQLAEGLSALHAAGLVHRDLKPNNVRVTPEGRVVLLDFGLATALDPKQQSTRVSALGTIAYMAPEQAAAAKLGPAADWYAFGVCLYEALTGLLPIDAENPLALLIAKQQLAPAAASKYRRGIPADLDQLCCSLLAIEPDLRPSGRTVRNVLTSAFTASSSPPSEAAPGDGANGFEGREQELELIEQAFARVKTGSQQLTLVEGESGIGKTALVEHFLDSLQTRQREILLLRSRCYENELLAFKAFDGAIDELARVLAKLDSVSCEALLPPQAALLGRLFPALAAVQALAKAPLRGLAADPAVQRLEAFSVFVRLLDRMSKQSPIVFVIDDLQWADAESFRLLRALLGDSQPPRCLILATVRPPTELDGETAASVDALGKLSCTTYLRLHGLPHAKTWALARDLMGPAIPDAWLEIMVRESAGHPLFLTVLARFAESHDPKTAADLTLDAAIAARIGSLSKKACRLLETVAVVGSPLAASLCGRATGLTESELARLIAELCGHKLLRRRGAGEIACFHDRIRRVAVESLPGAQIRALHAEIAKVLAAHGHTDPVQLARHYQLAGELALAYQAYGRGAEKALSSLAFAQAAVLYARALEVSTALPLASSERTALRIARGHALARSGRSAEAARQYLEAAEQSEGEDKTQLRIWAAQHLLQSARVEEGMAAARELLEELGVPLPSSPGRALTRLMWDRTYLRMRGLQVHVATGPIPVQERMRLDALWGITRPLSWLDPLASGALNTRHLRLARALGEPTHMARALAEEAFVRAIQNPDDDAIDRLLVRARTLSQASKDPSFEVSLSFREATVATYRWDLPRARERLEHAQRVHTESCPDQPWLLTNVRTNLSMIWATVGEHALLATSCAAWLAEAHDRCDQFALTMIETIGYGSFRHLMVNDPDGGRIALSEALAPWPREPFSHAHFGEVIGITYIELYRGGDGAHAWLERELPRLSQAFLLKMGIAKASFLMFRAYACLAAHRGAGTERAAQLLHETRTRLRELKHINSKLAHSNALSLEAQLAALSGELDSALDKTRKLRALAESQGNFLMLHSLGYFEGLLEAGDAGREKQRAALDFFANQGWKQPRRALAMRCPVIDLLETQK